MELARPLAKKARELREEVRRGRPGTWWTELRGRLRVWLETATHRSIDDDPLTDTLVQSVVCGMVALQFARRRFKRGVLRRVMQHCGPLVESLLKECDPAGRNGRRFPQPLSELAQYLSPELSYDHREKSPPNGGAMLHFFEPFLNSFDAGARQRHGVFYTPPPVARHIVNQADRLLRKEFGLVDGLADLSTWGDLQRRCPEMHCPGRNVRSAPFVRILDPAAGTGIFLTEVIDRVHRTLTAKWRSAGKDDSEIRHDWNQYVSRDLLPRIVGLELMLPAALLATMQVAYKLADTGYQFRAKRRIRIYVTDTLAGPHAAKTLPDLSAPWRRELRDIGQAGYGEPVTVVLGNPPFSGISQNRSPWINGLLKGESDQGPAAAGYYQVDGQPLGERKVWLQDDYVKFLRYAHWQIERAGCGLIGFVTNHGYLDNASFRGMRQRLIESFPRITVVDLHGNRKKKETTPAGDVDESVFPIEQGVAIGLFRRPVDTDGGEIRHCDVWGTREEKIRILGQACGPGRGRAYCPPVATLSSHVPRGPRVRSLRSSGGLAGSNARQLDRGRHRARRVCDCV